MEAPPLIYCANGNREKAEIALAAGFRYGAQLPGVCYFPPYFIDQNWKKPNRAAYLAILAEKRPYMASVLDWERTAQLPEVLEWAEEAARWVEVVLIIPKVHGELYRLPRQIGGKPVRLGYPVPNGRAPGQARNQWSGNPLTAFELHGWPVHLLGGSPGAQHRLAYQLQVASADGNMMNKLSNRGLFWTPGRKPFTNTWVSLKTADGDRFAGNGPLEAFRRSCARIMAAWVELYKDHPVLM